MLPYSFAVVIGDQKGACQNVREGTVDVAIFLQSETDQDFHVYCSCAEVAQALAKLKGFELAPGLSKDYSGVDSLIYRGGTWQQAVGVIQTTLSATESVHSHIKISRAS